MSSATGKNNDQTPPPRHKHSAVLHGDEMWIYGGMTDLQERSDLWKWDTQSRKWCCIKTKINPGPLHSHAACKMPSSMLIFGGERSGQTSNDLWKFNFGTESWEKITISGLKPQPRAESIAFTVSELLLNQSSTSLESKAVRIRRNCSSAERGNRHSSYLPNNRVAPVEKTYVFQASQNNYIDGSDLAQQYSENRSSRSFLQEISKISQINMSRIGAKCSYTVLSGGATTDSTESLLRQHSSPQTQELDLAEIETATPTRGTMVKSKSAYVIKKKYQIDSTPSPDENKEPIVKKRVEFDSTVKKITREPISVPNFSTLTLPTPVLTPVEAAKLVYLTDEETDLESDPLPPTIEENITQVKSNNENDEINVYENFKPVKRGESYSSHLAYADNPLYQHMINSLEEHSEGNVSSTSDYASIETVNRLSSASNYSVKMNTPQEENLRNREKDKDGPFGFCNPNYMGPDIKSILTNDDKEKKAAVKMFAVQEKITTERGICGDSNFKGSDEDILELQNYNGVIDINTKVLYRHSCRSNRPPKSLALQETVNNHKADKYRALSASRVERNRTEKNPNGKIQTNVDPHVPLYVYVMGGKEQGQVTVFQRPISIWKLKLF